MMNNIKRCKFCLRSTKYHVTVIDMLKKELFGICEKCNEFWNEYHYPFHETSAESQYEVRKEYYSPFRCTGIEWLSSTLEPQYKIYVAPVELIK